MTHINNIYLNKNVLNKNVNKNSLSKRLRILYSFEQECNIKGLRLPSFEMMVLPESP